MMEGTAGDKMRQMLDAFVGSGANIHIDNVIGVQNNLYAYQTNIITQGCAGAFPTDDSAAAPQPDADTIALRIEKCYAEGVLNMSVKNELTYVFLAMLALRQTEDVIVKFVAMVRSKVPQVLSMGDDALYVGAINDMCKKTRMGRYKIKDQASLKEYVRSIYTMQSKLSEAMRKIDEVFLIMKGVRDA